MTGRLSHRVPFGAWVVLAALAHGVLFASLRPDPAPPLGLAVSTRRDFSELSLVEVEVETAPALEMDVASGAAGGVTEGAGAVARAAAPLAHGSPRVESGPPGDGILSSGEPSPEPAGSAGEGSPGPAERRLSLEQLGAGLAGNAFVKPSEGPPVRPSAEARLEQSMREEIVASEVKLGLTRSGPVSNALRDATYAEAPATSGSALFSATVDASGLVVSLEPTSVPADFNSWERVARQAAKALAKKRLRVPSGASGLRVRFRITSESKLPSGRDPGLAINAFGIPVKKGEGKNSTKISLFEPMVSVRTDNVLGPGGDTRELPVLNVGIGIFGLAGDPVDIGAKPRRVVHVELLEEKPL